MTRWKENQGASEHVFRLLEESGALLEQRVSEKSREFVRSIHNKHGVRADSNSVAYGLDTEESPFRQIDQCVSLYKEFVIDERNGIALRAQIPIEVKNRRDVEVFGIEYEPDSYRPRMPIMTAMQGSRLSLTIKNTVPFERVPLLGPVLLEIKDGATPQKVFEENLVYNAAGAIYSFIEFNLSPSSDNDGSHTYGSEIIRKMGLVEKFEKYLSKKNYGWWVVMYWWMRSNLTDALATEFNRRIHPGLPHSILSHSIDAYFPILCVNGSLWRHSPSKFSECEALLTKVRVKGWPGKFRQRVLYYTAEVPLLVTNPNGLVGLFREALRWFLKIEKGLKSADRMTKHRWHIESAFYQAAVRHFMHQQPWSEIRSDSDFFDQMERLGERSAPKGFT
jgi:hypothetical protein